MSGQPTQTPQVACEPRDTSALAKQTIGLMLASRSSFYSVEDLTDVNGRHGSRNCETFWSMCRKMAKEYGVDLADVHQLAGSKRKDVESETASEATEARTQPASEGTKKG